MVLVTALSHCTSIRALVIEQHRGWRVDECDSKSKALSGTERQTTQANKLAVQCAARLEVVQARSESASATQGAEQHAMWLVQGVQTAMEVNTREQIVKLSTSKT